jgi:hypothetical protein
MKLRFLTAQVRHFLSTFRLRQTWRHRAAVLIEAPTLLWNVARFERAVRRARPTLRHNATCTVVLLSHNRPENIGPIVRSALRNTCIHRVIVSNSNSNVRMADWLRIDDPRLEVVDEQRPTQPGHRFVIAQREKADLFLSIDDDIFLTPHQWAEFFQRLLDDPEVPHGIMGNRFLPGTTSSNGSPFHHVTGIDCEVDVLIGAYAFTRVHLNRVFFLAEALQMLPMSDIRNGEDILLSFSGSRRPRLHDLGPLFCCYSMSLPGIALWKSHRNFWTERTQLFERVRTTRESVPDAWNKNPEG